MTKGEGVRAGRVIDAQLHLLDRQMLDVDGVPVTTVDDLEISDIPEGDIPPGTEAPVILTLLDGPTLGTRIFGGRPPRSRWTEIPWSDVADIDTALHLRRSSDEYDATWTERWVRDRIIRRIPGGRHDPE